MKLPVVGITMGDAAGVGPEVVMKALARADPYAFCRPLVIGDRRQMERAKAILKLNLEIRSVADPKSARFNPGTLDLLDLGLLSSDIPFGKVSAAAGEAAYRYIERAVQLALDGLIDAICTAPINKEALNAAGHRYPGHTELLAKLTGTREVSLTLLSPKLRVIHVTAHIGLLDAIEKIDAALVERTIARGRELLVRAGTREPRIGVCGINPHAGEGGLFGRGEEAQKIVPAVAAARARGWKVDGPLPADSLFYVAARGDYDLVVAMYHDQGHGPVKALGLEHGVNVTAGLPIVRTSVDHGTAFDIAGTGTADEQSMIEALRQAALLAPR
ncbi:MAG: 4-hydroxythreonine-4-phosphate dehydrogenase PdxA [Betaproteobacteria bacterium RIFCSPLOWO2_12_FULL_68_19]|nr:MAG: 4-hydroxythreonine-4-phosphate dehydrogenase PdxA [Betaproteobacteria bacterium RIFCSPLOWO2_12_FULL_68_19]